MKQKIEIEGPAGWEVVSIDLDRGEVLDCSGEFYRDRASVKLRRVHVWPEAVLQYARFVDARWLSFDSDGATALFQFEPEPATVDDTWSNGGEFVAVPSEWAPPHDHIGETGEGWRNCKWRLPVEDKQ